jgi:hypothetical protein
MEQVMSRKRYERTNGSRAVLKLEPDEMADCGAAKSQVAA